MIRPRLARRIRLLGLGLALTLGLAACGTTPTETATDTPTRTAGFPRTVSHFRGSTEFVTQPTRVVTLDNSYADAVLLLESTLVGYVEYRAPGLPDYLGDARQRFAADAGPVGTTGAPRMEAIAALNPDLILSAEVRDGERYETLSKLAPTVFSQTTGPTWKDNIRLAAKALGKEELAEQKIADYQARAKAIGDEINAEHGNPTVSVVRFAGEPTARLYRTTSFSGVVLADAGLARPASQQADPNDPTNIMNSISPELITEAEADVIFVTTYADPNGDAAKAAQPFLNSRLWANLSGRKINVEDSLWMTPVSIQGAHKILDDLAKTFEVDPHLG